MHIRPAAILRSLINQSSGVGCGGSVLPNFHPSSTVLPSWYFSIPHLQNGHIIRQQSTVAALNNVQQDSQVAWEDAKPFKSIPGDSFFHVAALFYRQPELKLKLHLMLDHMFGKHGDIFKLPTGRTIVVVRQIEDIKTLLAADGKMPNEPLFDFFNDYRNKFRKDLYPHNSGLLGSQGEAWYTTRAAVQQDMLRPKSAMYYIDDIAEISSDFCHLLDTVSDEGLVEDVTPLVYRWALEATGTVFLDHRIGCLESNLDPNSDALRMIDCVNTILGETYYELLNSLPFYKIYPTKAYRTFDAASTELYNISRKFIDKSIKKYGSIDAIKTKSAEMSVIEKLLQKCGPDSGIPLVMAMDALMAGIDTTGNSASFLLYHLATNPDKQEKLYQEIVQVLGGYEKDSDSTKKITEEQLNQMKYLRAVQQESQRMKPAAPGFMRKTNKDLVLSGYQIPAGSLVSAAILHNMRSEKHFEQADKFEPERWLRQSSKIDSTSSSTAECPKSRKEIKPYSYLPFSHGPRMCIGRRFAELELLLLTIKIVQRYSLKYENDRPIDISAPMVVRPDGPVRIRFEKR